MKKIILCLAVILFCSAFTLGQSKSVRQVTAKNSWQAFFTKFKITVKERNETVFKSLLQAKGIPLTCHYWKFCPALGEEEENRKPDLIIKALKKNNNQGWKQVEKLLRTGKLSTGWEFEGKSYKSINARANPGCDSKVDLSIDFVFKDGRWQIIGFGISGCEN